MTRGSRIMPLHQLILIQNYAKNKGIVPRCNVFTKKVLSVLKRIGGKGLNYERCQPEEFQANFKRRVPAPRRTKHGSCRGRRGSEGQASDYPAISDEGP